MNRNQFNSKNIARSYDDWFRTPLGKVCDKLEKRALACALPDPRSGARLLDAGCGTGHFSAFFAERGFKVTGVDISAEMIEVARQNTALKADFQRAALTALPFGDESFDVVTAITVMEFIPEREKALQEMIRVLRIGGTLIIAVLNESSPLAHLRRWKGSTTFKNAQLFSTQRLQQFLAGLRDIEVEISTFVLPMWGLMWTHPATEFLGKNLRWRWGNFLVGKAKR